MNSNDLLDIIGDARDSHVLDQVSMVRGSVLTAEGKACLLYTSPSPRDS